MSELTKRPYTDLIVDIVDYPKPGVVFKDLTPLFENYEAFAAAVHDMVQHFAGRGITKVMGAEARGFIFGAPVALGLEAGFVAARKPGKLPRETMCASYELEYGTDTIEINADAISDQDVVLIVDDLVATGGTARAMADLVHRAGARVAGFGFLMELAFLHPREELAQACDAEVFSLIAE